MLKNKKQLLLIVAVLALYAAIALRFKDFVGQEEAYVRQQNWQIESIEAAADEEFRLALDYPDPFRTKKQYVRREAPTDGSAQGYARRYRVQPQQQVDIAMPPRVQLELIGTINAEDQSQDLCILKAENKEHVLKVGDSLKGYHIHQIYHDSVVALWQSKRYTYKTKAK